MSTERYSLPIRPISREAFAPFGELLDDASPNSFLTNEGTARRYHRLGIVDCSQDSGTPLLSIFQILSTTIPSSISMMERHPVSSQAFMPLNNQRFVVIVSPPDRVPIGHELQAFITNGTQGVNYRRGTWHHPLISLDTGNFLVVDRSGPNDDFDQDCEEVTLQQRVQLDAIV